MDRCGQGSAERRFGLELLTGSSHHLTLCGSWFPGTGLWEQGGSYVQYLGVCGKYCVALTGGSQTLRMRQCPLVELMIIVQVYIDSTCQAFYTLSLNPFNNF